MRDDERLALVDAVERWVPGDGCAGRRDEGRHHDSGGERAPRPRTGVRVGCSHLCRPRQGRPPGNGKQHLRFGGGDERNDQEHDDLADAQADRGDNGRGIRRDGVGDRGRRDREAGEPDEDRDPLQHRALHDHDDEPPRQPAGRSPARCERARHRAFAERERREHQNEAQIDVPDRGDRERVGDCGARRLHEFAADEAGNRDPRRERRAERNMTKRRDKQQVRRE